MAEYIVSEKQLELINSSILGGDSYRLAEENWNKFSKEDKDFIIETLFHFYPEKKGIIKEASWYNTLGDVVGIFDPTGVVDFVNGISYISQGDKLFGFLSLISAVPYIGDVIAKPVMAALKLGKPSAKGLQQVLKLSEAGKTKEAAELLARLNQGGGITAVFTKGVGQAGSKLKEYLKRTPMPVIGGFKRTIIQWIELFEKGAKGGITTRKVGQRLARRFTKLTPELRAKNLQKLIELSKNTSGLFSGYRTSKGLLSGKTLFRGMPQLMGRNASVRALMRQSKWWLGFLDYIGFGNYVGPDEYIAKVGQGEFENKINQYQQTPEANSYFDEEYGEQQSQQPTQPTQQQTQSAQQDPLQKFFTDLFKGAINPLP